MSKITNLKNTLSEQGTSLTADIPPAFKDAAEGFSADLELDIRRLEELRGNIGTGKTRQGLIGVLISLRLLLEDMVVEPEKVLKHT